MVSTVNTAFAFSCIFFCTIVVGYNVVCFVANSVLISAWCRSPDNTPCCEQWHFCSDSERCQIHLLRCLNLAVAGSKVDNDDTTGICLESWVTTEADSEASADKKLKQTTNKLYTLSELQLETTLHALYEFAQA